MSNIKLIKDNFRLCLEVRKKEKKKKMRRKISVYVDRANLPIAIAQKIRPMLWQYRTWKDQEEGQIRWQDDIRETVRAKKNKAVSTSVSVTNRTLAYCAIESDLHLNEIKIDQQLQPFVLRSIIKLGSNVTSIWK